jgi:single-stranded-DNA-specific exonuclease
MIAFDMMMGDETKALELRGLNEERQIMVNSCFEEALELTEREFVQASGIILSQKHWPTGIIGLLAGKLCERYHKPVICFTEVNGRFVGSCRSIPEINIVEWLRKFEPLFIGFGGHAQAAGLTITRENLPKFKMQFLDALMDFTRQHPIEAKLVMDTEIRPEEMTLDALNTLQNLEPFGMGNPKPRFLLRNMKVMETRMVGNDQQHLQLRVFDGKRVHKGIAFQMAEHAKTLQSWGNIDMVCQLQKNEWKGNISVELQMLDARETNRKRRD